MRPVTRLTFEGVRPADLSGVSEPIFEMVSPGDLLIDERYQRSISPKSVALIRKIVAEWSWLKFKPPICALTEAGLEIVDGQHGALAAVTHGGIARIPVIIVDQSSFEDRAEAFVSHATVRVATTASQIWRAQLAAGDEAAREIDEVCTEAGIRLLPFAPSKPQVFQPGETISISAVRSCLRRRGRVKAVEVLSVCAATGTAPVTGDMIRAVEAALSEPEYATEFDAERLVATFRAMGPKLHVEVREMAAARALPTWRALVAVLFKNRVRRALRSATAAETAPDHAPMSHPAPPIGTGPIVNGISRTSTGGRLIDRRPASSVVNLGDMPGPGRSALDQRRSAGR